MKDKRSSPAQLVGVRQVAARAGVSPMTVSRALSRPDLVATDTRERVERAAREVGYVPNRVAAALSSSRNNVVGVIVPTLQNPISTWTLQGLTGVLNARDLQLMIGEYGGSLEKEAALVRAFLAYRPVGLVLQSTVHTPDVADVVARAGVPVVETGNLITDPLDAVVSFSNFKAARQMTSYLLARYRRVAYIGFSTIDNDRTRDRLRGYKAALKAAGVAFNPGYALEVPVEQSMGATALSHLIGKHPEIDAVFLAGNMIAVEALVECLRRGIRVPGRVALAGLDDSDIAEKLPPGLTTVRIPRAEIGRRSAEWLLQRLDDPGAAPVLVDVGFEIVVRGSA